MQLIAQHAQKALGELDEAERKKWELHVVGHSAGSIFAAHALRHLIDLKVTLKTVQLMAPAITVQAFKELVLPHVKAGDCPLPTMWPTRKLSRRAVGPGRSRSSRIRCGTAADAG